MRNRGMIFRGATDADWKAVERLLGASALPVDGARAHLDAFIVAIEGGDLLGCVGAEVYGTDALLRSLAVREDRRGTGLGDALTERMLTALKARGVTRVALLTTTAEVFFARRCFRKVPRDEVPAAVQASVEFQGACPASAVAMVLSL
jgi:N-acetylglutamate synthase-like GNAT family acetyltransferase